MNKILCRKCGADWTKLAGFLREHNILACQACSEPMPELMELDKAGWEEGDHTPDDGGRD